MSGRTPKWIRRSVSALSTSAVSTGPLVAFMSAYLKLVHRSNRWAFEPADALERARRDAPAIFTAWHGQHILLPCFPFAVSGAAMVSRNADAELAARLLERFGARAIRASGGRNPSTMLRKGGIEGFAQMLDALGAGEGALQIADVPHGAPRRAGGGIVRLAKYSGRPILALGIATSRRVIARRSWDRTALNLPFGRGALCLGEPIRVAADAEGEALEASRMALERELNRVTARAYELTGNPETPALASGSPGGGAAGEGDSGAQSFGRGAPEAGTLKSGGVLGEESFGRPAGGAPEAGDSAVESFGREAPEGGPPKSEARAAAGGGGGMADSGEAGRAGSGGAGRGGRSP